MRRYGALASVLVFLCGGAFGASGSGPVKCLMVGTGPHGEAVMDDVLRDIKENYPSVAITVTENLEDLRLENFKQYDVFLPIQIKAENGQPPDFAKEGILVFLKGGGGLVVTHFAVSN
ncbi:MAG: hypothetical protein NTZ09_13640, partial [Candidatus Hydrogenedentes bacterium]|nr:hypothetical protein [Candidatus Hydrogenedentota bacterium]